MKNIMVLVIVFGIFIFIVFISLFVYWALSTQKEQRNIILRRVEKLSNAEASNLSNAKIFFGHQSVGQNVVDGLDAIVKKSQNLSLNIFETKHISSIPEGTLAHWNIGRNTRPESKLRAFKKIMLESSGGAIDLAMMKFCYVDISYGSEPEKILDLYSETISELQKALPDTVFVHMTVPLESMPVHPKAVVRRLVKVVLGRTDVVESNAARQRYNELLRSRYGGREPVFDLAMHESVDDEGRVTVFTSGGEAIEFMESRKTYDGGHLNDHGRKLLGGELLVFLAEFAPDVP